MPFEPHSDPPDPGGFVFSGPCKGGIASRHNLEVLGICVPGGLLAVVKEDFHAAGIY